MTTTLNTPMTINIPTHRTCLVDLNVARVLTGLDQDTILARIERGEILHAFNIAILPDADREIRIWFRDLFTDAKPFTGRLEDAIDAIIGHRRPWLRSGEVNHILLCSRPHISRLVDEHLLVARRVANVHQISRASLVSFLISRALPF